MRWQEDAVTVLGQLGHLFVELFCWGFFMSWKAGLGCVDLYKYLKQEIAFYQYFPCSHQNLNPH